MEEVKKEYYKSGALRTIEIANIPEPAPASKMEILFFKYDSDGTMYKKILQNHPVSSFTPPIPRNSPA